MNATPEAPVVERLLTTPEAAKLLALSPRTLEDYRLREGSGPPYVTLARNAVRYRMTSLLAWVSERERRGGG
jgi:predicted DNA-binding transcriptional regulator AlpA